MKLDELGLNPEPGEAAGSTSGFVGSKGSSMSPKRDPEKRAEETARKMKRISCMIPELRRTKSTLGCSSPSHPISWATKNSSQGPA